jgi:mono/diheme cytochrome c family protein
VFLTAALLLAATAARAADEARGRHLAFEHCAACHSVGEHAGSAHSEAPPFPAIARKYAHNADAIAQAIAGPHPKMNFAPSAADGADIAAYIATLGK